MGAIRSSSRLGRPQLPAERIGILRFFLTKKICNSLGSVAQRCILRPRSLLPSRHIQLGLFASPTLGRVAKIPPRDRKSLTTETTQVSESPSSHTLSTLSPTGSSRFARQCRAPNDEPPGTSILWSQFSRRYLELCLTQHGKTGSEAPDQAGVIFGRAIVPKTRD